MHATCLHDIMIELLSCNHAWQPLYDCTGHHVNQTRDDMLLGTYELGETSH